MFPNANKDDAKKKGAKRKRKKAPIEPQKPSSAYALFFRDTQAAIKAENSTATFGEISKIVASMWDSLSEDAKQVYKQKTEAAKKEYLKQLAVYRAYMVTKGGDMEEEDSQPLSVLREKMAEERASSTSPKFADAGTSKTPIIDLTDSGDLPPPPKLHLAPGMQLTESVVKLRQLPPHTQGTTILDNNNLPLDGATARPISPGPVLTKIIVPGQNGSQSTIHIINSGSQGTPGTQQAPGTSVTPVPPAKHIVLKPIPTAHSPSGEVKPSTSTNPPPIQLRNIVSHPTSPVTILPSKPGQIIKVLHSETGGIKIASVPTTSVKGRIIKMVDVVHPTAPSAPISPDVTTVLGGTRTTSTIQHPQVQPILQLLAQESTDGGGAQGAGGTQGVGAATNTVHPVTPPLEQPFTIDLITDTEDEPMTPDEELLPMDTSVPEDPSDTHISNSPEQPENNDHEPSPRICIREGCGNIAVSNPLWDEEYCSTECVFSHCKDVFNAWVSNRQVAVA